MTSPNQERTTPYRPWITVLLIISVFWGVILWSIVGITGYFRLSSEATTLRTAFMNSVPGGWHKRVAVRVGWFTTAAARLGSSFFTMPPEPRAALNALRGAEVGVYHLEQAVANLDARAILKSADREMKSRGWDRVVGVVTKDGLVAIYYPHQKSSSSRVKCCALVFQDNELVVSSVRGNLDPILNLARQHLKIEDLKGHLNGMM